MLSTVMGVPTRPADNEFVKQLDQYLRLIGRDEGESVRARKLRAKLAAMSPRDPALDDADLEMKRCKILRQMGRHE